MENMNHPWWPENPAIYDIKKTYIENAEQGPFFDGEIPIRRMPPESEWKDFLGYKVASPLGIPAGPLLNSKWIGLAGQLGFDIPTYKTIRSHEHPAHPLPNVVPVEIEGQLRPSSLPPTLSARRNPPDDMSQLGITNSFGNPSRTREYLLKDIPKANALLRRGQVMIVSVFGTKREGISVEEDFAETASFAKECGAKIIEANFSCPNVTSTQGMLYSDPESVQQISSKIVEAIGDTPLIIKVGLFPNYDQMRETFIAAARAGVRAICGINTISMRVVDNTGDPALGENRLTCGICGNPIRDAALEFIRRAVKINEKEKLGLTILGTGGVVLPEHFDAFVEAGAEVAMTATGMMWDPLLGMRWHFNHRKPRETTFTKVMSNV